jgi:Bifunctional DNA primase/polymerase, N-terminal
VVVVVADFVTCPQGHRFWGDAHTPCPWCIGVAEGVVTADEALLLSWPTDYRPEPLVTPQGLRLGEFASVAVQVNGLSLLDAAVAYAEVGIPVFPCEPNGKRPHPAMRPPSDGDPSGLHRATTDPAAVERWWQAHPESNIGLRTGVVFDVLDVDVKNDAPGWESLTRAARHGFTVGVFAQASTPSGGAHLLLSPSGEGNHSKASLGLDTRGVGGYVLAAPSVIDGKRYEWSWVDPARFGPVLDWSGITGLLSPPAPVRTYTPKEGVQGSLAGLLRVVGESQPGGRNNALAWAVARAVDDGLDPWPLVDAAVAVGLPEWEARRTVESMARHVGGAS